MTTIIIDQTSQATDSPPGSREREGRIVPRRSLLDPHAEGALLGPLEREHAIVHRERPQGHFHVHARGRRLLALRGSRQPARCGSEMRGGGVARDAARETLAAPGGAGPRLVEEGLHSERDPSRDDRVALGHVLFALPARPGGGRPGRRACAELRVKDDAQRRRLRRGRQRGCRGRSTHGAGSCQSGARGRGRRYDGGVPAGVSEASGGGGGVRESQRALCCGCCCCCCGCCAGSDSFSADSRPQSSVQPWNLTALLQGRRVVVHQQ